MQKSKYSLLLKLFALISLSLLLTSSARAWRVQLPGGSRAETVVVDAAGNVIAAGRAYYGGEVIKLSGTTGQLIWQFNASHNETEKGVNNIALDSHGDVFVLFAIQRAVTKISGVTGQVIWVGIIGGTAAGCQNNFFAIAVDHEDNVVVAGTTGCLFSVAKLDGATGNERWHYEHEGYAIAVAVDPFGNVAAAGIMNLNFGTVKLRGTDGSQLWRKEINGLGTTTNVYGDEQANAVAMDKDGSVVAVGSTSNGRDNPRDFTVVKYLADGSTDWIQIINGFFRVTLTGDDASDDTANAVVIDQEGSVIAAGLVQESLDIPRRPEPEHFHVIKISRNGNVVWSKPAEDLIPAPPGEPEYIQGRAFSLSVNAVGNIVAGGMHGNRFTLVKFWGRTGGRAWRQQLTSGTDGYNQAIRVVMDAASDIVAAGETIPLEGGLSQFTVVKLNRKDGLDYGEPPDPPFPPPDPSLTPVIFIPGIAGSRLAIPTTHIELWPGLPFIPHDSLGLNPANAPCPPSPTSFACYRPNVDVTGVIRETIPSKPVYKRLLDDLRRAGYAEDGDRPTLFVFAYDWRKSNAVNALLLRDKVIEIRQRYPNTKVNIVTHSMGGLLARRYIIDNPDPELHHVDKLVTIAAPWLGAPKALLALETGEFLPLPSSLIIRRSTLKTLVDFYPSVHELMPSVGYFHFGGSPFAEDEWDINRNGIKYENYDYPQMFGLFNERHRRSLPAQAGLEFHSRLGQDDWRNKGFGVRYYHLYGWKPRSETIHQVVTNKGIRCTPLFDCDGPFIFVPRVGPGDGTVPIISAKRITPSGSHNYNEENAKLYPFTDGELAEHVKLTQNPKVLNTIRSILSSAPQSTAARSQEPEPVTQQAYYLRVEGVASAAITDEADNATEPLGDAPEGGVPEVSSYLMAADSFLSILPTDDSYTLRLVTGQSPFAINLTKGTDIETAQAIRYLDLDLPAATSVRLEITPEGVGELSYDSNGDGTFDTAIMPTVSVSGSAAQDTEPPTVTISATAQRNNSIVTITSSDAGSGVKTTYYSLDGAHFQPYSGSFTVDSFQAPVVYAFADDNVANRSGLVTYYPTIAPNQINNALFFVRQHYGDFLNREPDAAGLAFWTNQITSCGSDAQCIEIRRINVSAAFFLSIEFQETGYLVYRMYKAAYGNLPGAPVPVRFDEFLPDTQQMGQGVQVGIGDWQTQLENNKVAFSLDFVSRSRFAATYPTSLSPADFVDALFANAGITPSSIERTEAITEFGSSSDTSDTAARARALRRIAEHSTLKQQELNKAFVLMQYFGYLRRNPNDPPESGLDFAGYDFWLGKLNQFYGNFVDAEMVKAFIVSGEYQQRFGP